MVGVARRCLAPDRHRDRRRGPFDAAADRLYAPYLSTDVYRYVWDGRVIAAGIDPYRYVPADPHLEALRDPDIFPEINRANSAVTIYPPIAEALFFAVTRVSETASAMKAAMAGFEIVTFVLLVHLLAVEGLPSGRVLVSRGTPCRYGNLPAAAMSTAR